jgi:hypothetical protein
MTLEDIYPKYAADNGGGDKGTAHSYLPVYTKHIRRGIESLLEVGVWEGNSLAMWEEYLPGTIVIGLDNDMSRLKHKVDARECDATNPDSVREAIGEQMFDVIIDDGSHVVSDQIRSFDILFERVKPGGLYFIEDINGNAAMEAIRSHLAKCRVEFSIFDLRAKKNRYDDILAVVFA